MDHYDCDRGYGTAGNERWELAGHEAVVGAAEGKSHEVVEVGLVGVGMSDLCDKVGQGDRGLTVGWLFAKVS